MRREHRSRGLSVSWNRVSIYHRHLRPAAVGSREKSRSIDRSIAWKKGKQMWERWKKIARTRGGDRVPRSKYCWIGFIFFEKIFFFSRSVTDVFINYSRHILSISTWESEEFFKAINFHLMTTVNHKNSRMMWPFDQSPRQHEWFSIGKKKKKV